MISKWMIHLFHYMTRWYCEVIIYGLSLTSFCHLSPPGPMALESKGIILWTYCSGV
jgi:hypothetical protein